MFGVVQDHSADHNSLYLRSFGASKQCPADILCQDEGVLQLFLVFYSICIVVCCYHAVKGLLTYFAENEPENPVEAEEVAVEEQEQEQDGETETDSDSDDSSVDVIYPPGPPDDPHYERLKKQLDSWAYRKTHWHNDVEALPEDRSPMGHDWDNSVAICAIMRGEFMTDVREWLLYHKCVSLLCCIWTAFNFTFANVEQ